MADDLELNYASVEFPGVGCVGKHSAMRGEQKDTTGPFASEVKLLAPRKLD
jgi:hypothetical protein